MGTRSLTAFYEGDSEDAVAVLYRQYDGYPSGHGTDLAEALEGHEVVNGLTGEANVYNGIGDLAVRVIAKLKGDPDEPGNFYLISPAKMGEWADGVDFVYAVRAEPGRHITIEIKDSGYDAIRPEKFSALVEKIEG